MVKALTPPPQQPRMRSDSDAGVALLRRGHHDSAHGAAGGRSDRPPTPPRNGSAPMPAHHHQAPPQAGLPAWHSDGSDAPRRGVATAGSGSSLASQRTASRAGSAPRTASRADMRGALELNAEVLARGEGAASVSAGARGSSDTVFTDLAGVPLAAAYFKGTPSGAGGQKCCTIM
jgi:hypothetical protein